MRIGFFGCSFTEGGGLDGVEWNKYGLKNKLISSKWDIEKNGKPDEGLDTRPHRNLCEKYAKQHRFSHLVGQKLNCEVENLSQSRSSNEFIIDKLGAAPFVGFGTSIKKGAQDSTINGVAFRVYGCGIYSGQTQIIVPLESVLVLPSMG